MPEVQVEEVPVDVNEVDVDQLIADFEHQDLSDYNPDFKAIDEDVYRLRLVGTPKEFKGIGKNGKPWFRKSMAVAVVEGPNAGRRVFVNEFPNVFTRFARKVMDATGISQDANETVSDFLTKVAGINDAVFLAKVEKFFDDYRQKDDNRVVVSSISAV